MNKFNIIWPNIVSEISSLIIGYANMIEYNVNFYLCLKKFNFKKDFNDNQIKNILK